MQGHLSDTQDIDQYMRALQKYSAAVDVVHITELDVGCSRTDETAWYYQAEFYYKFFAPLLRALSTLRRNLTPPARHRSLYRVPYVSFCPRS